MRPFHVVAVALVIGGCKAKTEASAEPLVSATPAPKQAPPAPPPPEESPVDKIRKMPTLESAFAFAKPDDSTNDVDRGTLLLTAWAVPALQWRDVAVAKDETSYALVMKDSDAERGKRLCVSGSIIQIETNKVSFGKFYDGLLLSYAENLFKFHGVKSSGTLVQGSQARFCGVVTGKYDYANSGGGTGHAVALVGMFDLAENKR